MQISAPKSRVVTAKVRQFCYKNVAKMLQKCSGIKNPNENKVEIALKWKKFKLKTPARYTGGSA